MRLRDRFRNRRLPSNPHQVEFREDMDDVALSRLTEDEYDEFLYGPAQIALPDILDPSNNWETLRNRSVVSRPQAPQTVENIRRAIMGRLAIRRANEKLQARNVLRRHRGYFR